MRIAADTDLTLTTGMPALVNGLTNPETSGAIEA